MAVAVNNGNTSDNSVGLVAVSSWQGWMNHTPRKSEVEQPGFGVSNLTRFASTFSWSSPKAAVGYFKNGHTAICVRRQGQLKHVVGFNPNSYLWAGLLQTCWGNDITVAGLWYDDMAMCNDPTAVSYEINVTADQAKTFSTLIKSLVGRSDLGPNSPGTQYYYSFRPANTETTVNGIVGNCGNMGLLILCQFLTDVGKPEYVEMFTAWVRQNQSTQNFGQGPMMGAISSGFGK